ASDIALPAPHLRSLRWLASHTNGTKAAWILDWWPRQRAYGFACPVGLRVQLGDRAGASPLARAPRRRERTHGGDVRRERAHQSRDEPAGSDPQGRWRRPLSIYLDRQSRGVLHCYGAAGHQLPPPADP